MPPVDLNALVEQLRRYIFWFGKTRGAQGAAARTLYRVLVASLRG